VEIAAGILLFFAAQWFAAALGFVFNFPITPLPFFVGLVAAGVFVFVSTQKRLLNLAILFGLIAGSMLLTLPVRDISWDGNSYHLDAILVLSGGWNPFRQITPLGTVFAEWLAYFSKGAWYSETSAYMLFREINITKYGTILMLVPPALIFYEVLRSVIQNRTLRIFWSVLFVLNPVAIYQLFTKYIDGQLGALVGVIVALFLLRNVPRKRSWYVALGCVLILLFNIKLTGALFAAILIGGFLCFELLRRRFDRVAWGTCVVTTIIAVFIGWNPYITQYVTNTIAHRAPFYPTTYNELTHMDENIPSFFVGKNSFEKMFISLFSRTDSGKKEFAGYKIPFTFDLLEVHEMIYWDVRIGGFGPLFGGIILLMILALVVGGRGLTWDAGSLSILLVLCTVINPEMWWARYVPGLWLIPILVALFNCPNGARTSWSRWLLAAAIVGNILLTAIPVVLRTLEIVRG